MTEKKQGSRVMTRMDFFKVCNTFAGKFETYQKLHSRTAVCEQLSKDSGVTVGAKALLDIQEATGCRLVYKKPTGRHDRETYGLVQVTCEAVVHLYEQLGVPVPEALARAQSAYRRRFGVPPPMTAEAQAEAPAQEVGASAPGNGPPQTIAVPAQITPPMKDKPRPTFVPVPQPRQGK